MNHTLAICELELLSLTLADATRRTLYASQAMLARHSNYGQTHSRPASAIATQVTDEQRLLPWRTFQVRRRQKRQSTRLRRDDGTMRPLVFELIGADATHTQTTIETTVAPCELNACVNEALTWRRARRAGDSDCSAGVSASGSYSFAPANIIISSQLKLLDLERQHNLRHTHTRNLNEKSERMAAFNSSLLLLPLDSVLERPAARRRTIMAKERQAD